MNRDANLYDACLYQHKRKFFLAVEGPFNHILDDHLVREVCSWLGFSIRLLGNTLMLVNKKWRRVFSSDKCWRGLSVSFPFMGTSAQGSAAGYEKWLIDDYGLPLYSSLRVLTVALKNPRMKIWIGNQPLKQWSPLDYFIWRERISRNVVLILDPSSSSTAQSSAQNLHQALVHLLPMSTAYLGPRCSSVLSGDVLGSSELISGHTIRCEVPSIAERKFNSLHILGDERCLFVRMSTNASQIAGQEKRIRSLIPRCRGLVFCLDASLLPPRLEEENEQIKRVLRQSWNTFASHKLLMTQDTATDDLHLNNSPIVIFVAISDLQYFNDHPGLDLKAAIKYRIASINKIFIDIASKSDCISSRREWWVQPYNPQVSDKTVLSQGYIAGWNYLLRAMNPILSSPR